MDKAALLTRRVADITAEVEVPGLGTVVVRGLSRWQMIAVFQLSKKPHRQEQLAISFGMVDPELTPEEVAEWQRCATASELEAVAQKINELSGIGPGAAKSVVSADGDGLND